MKLLTEQFTNRLEVELHFISVDKLCVPRRPLSASSQSAQRTALYQRDDLYPRHKLHQYQGEVS